MHKLSRSVYIILILTIFSLAGCYGPYKAERDYWLVSRKYARFLKEIESAKENDYQELIIDFRKIVLNYPFWQKSAEAQLIIASLYKMQDKEDKAINEYKKVIEDYPTAYVLCSKALFAIGLIHQVSGDWSEAERNLKKITEDYPETEAALQIPLYLARYYKSENQPERAKAAYDEAIRKYKEYINENPNSIKAVLSLDHIINCFGDEGRWQEALDFLRGTAEKHPQSPLELQSLFAMGKINETVLHNTQEAFKVYKEMIEKFPDNPLSKATQEHLASQKEGTDTDEDIK